jgi:uncharacterized repeat protein (TIGR01451 family)
LDCGLNGLTTLILNPSAPMNLLYASNNYLTSLEVSSLTSLTQLFCDHNLLNSLNVNNLVNLEILVCSNNQLPALDVSTLVSLNTLTCSYNLLTSLNVSQVPFLFNLNFDHNLLTTFNLNTIPYVNHLSIGNDGFQPLDYSLLNDDMSSFSFYGGVQTTLDISSMPLLNFFSLWESKVTSMDISSNHNLSSYSFSDNPDLQYIFAKTGGAPNYQFYTCPNLQYVCTNESQVAAIQTTINNSVGFNNVVVNSYCSFNPGGDYNTITGTLTFDGNNNGCGAGDMLGTNIRVNINDTAGTGASFANNTGNYTFYTQAGSFSINASIENPSWFNFSPNSVTIPFANNNNNVVTQNFCITPNGVHSDVEVVIAPVTPARPGFDAVYEIVYKNKGNQTLSGNVAFAYDVEALHFISSNVIPTSQSAGLLNYNYSNLLPFENRRVIVTLHVNAPIDNPAINIGDQLDFTATVSPIAGDENPADNTFQFHQTVVGSFDPNNVVCIEGDVVSPLEIGNYLHYIINFENTGTAAAENIVVRDVIDTNQFDVNSLQLLNSSAPVTAKLTGNVAEFIFPNINLHSGGHGNILIKVKSKNTLVTGDSVSKKANIYFDYNFPVETLPENTLFQSLSNPDIPVDASIAVYPNPTKGNININCSNTIQSVQLYDIQGRLLQTNLVNENQAIIDISSQANGVYFLKIISDKGMGVKKIVRE